MVKISSLKKNQHNLISNKLSKKSSINTNKFRKKTSKLRGGGSKQIIKSSRTLSNMIGDTRGDTEGDAETPLHLQYNGLNNNNNSDTQPTDKRYIDRLTKLIHTSTQSSLNESLKRNLSVINKLINYYKSDDISQYYKGSMTADIKSNASLELYKNQSGKNCIITSHENTSILEIPDGDGDDILRNTDNKVLFNNQNMNSNSNIILCNQTKHVLFLSKSDSDTEPINLRINKFNLETNVVDHHIDPKISGSDMDMEYSILCLSPNDNYLVLLQEKIKVQGTRNNYTYIQLINLEDTSKNSPIIRKADELVMCIKRGLFSLDNNYVLLYDFRNIKKASGRTNRILQWNLTDPTFETFETQIKLNENYTYIYDIKFSNDRTKISILYGRYLGIDHRSNEPSRLEVFDYLKDESGLPKLTLKYELDREDRAFTRYLSSVFSPDDKYLVTLKEIYDTKFYSNIIIHDANTGSPLLNINTKLIIPNRKLISIKHSSIDDEGKQYIVIHSSNGGVEVIVYKADQIYKSLNNNNNNYNDIDGTSESIVSSLSEYDKAEITQIVDFLNIDILKGLFDIKN